MSTLKKFAGQTAVYGLSTIISRLFNFFLTPVYVSVYPTTVFGILTKMFTWASVFNALLSFGMETTFFRYLNKYEGNKQKVFNNAFLTIAFISVLFFTGTFLFVDDIAEWLQQGSVQATADYRQYVRYFIFILIVDALAVIPFAKLRAEGRPGRYAVVKFLNILINVVLNLIFIYAIPYILHHDLHGASLVAGFREGWVGYVFIAQLVANILTLIILLPEMLQLQLNFDWPFVSEMLAYSFPVLVANFSFIINETSDKIFLGHLLPSKIADQQVGIYGACAKIAIFLNIFIQAFRLGAEPFFFNQAKNKNSGEMYARIMDYFIIVVSIIFVAIAANIEIFKYFIRGKDPIQQQLYWSGLRVVPLLLFGYVSLGIYMNLSIWYKLSDQTKYGLYISGAGAIITIVLNLIYIPKYSYMAAAWVSLIAYTSMMVLSYILGQKNYPIPYNLKKNLLYLIVAVVIVFLSFQIFAGNLIAGNILLTLFVAGILFVERSELKLLLKRK